MNRARWAALALWLAVSLLFLIVNRGAYKGYFQDDDLDNISWTRHLTVGDFATGVVTPRFFVHNFRPVGHAFFGFMARRFGLDFPRYVAAVHLLHLVNVALLWLLLRRLELGFAAASAGALLFAFHMAVFDALWKPMYVFDVFCGFFCLLSLLAWSHRRWVLSFVFFWLAYKSKELAVMLPAVLAAYEYWFGERRWRRLAPFFLVSLSFGLQGLLLNPHSDDSYTFRFSPAALWTSLSFYSSRVLLLPFAGLALIAVPLLVKDARVRFGLTAMTLLLVPMLLLPGRLFGAYLYVPLAGLAVAFAALAELRGPVPAALFFVLWLPANHLLLRQNRKQALAIADENRSYVSALVHVVERWPGMRKFVWDGRPSALAPWGVAGAIRWLWNAPVDVYSVEDEDLAERLGSDAVLLISWDPLFHKLYPSAREAGARAVAFVEMTRQTPVWQLEKGWHLREAHFRWARSHARARLARPAGARRFELTANISPYYIGEVLSAQVNVTLGGIALPPKTFDRAGWQTLAWDLPPADAGETTMELRVSARRPPATFDLQNFGLAVGSFGFRP